MKEKWCENEVAETGGKLIRNKREMVRLYKGKKCLKWVISLKNEKVGSFFWFQTYFSLYIPFNNIYYDIKF